MIVTTITEVTAMKRKKSILLFLRAIELSNLIHSIFFSICKI